MIIYLIFSPLTFASFLVLPRYICTLSQSSLVPDITTEQTGSSFSLLATGGTVSGGRLNGADSSAAMTSILTVAATEASRLVTFEKTTYIYSWNSTEFAINSTTSVRPDVDSPDGQQQGLRWSTLFLCLLVVATAFGNILLCLAVVTERRLQNMTNYFLTSLAVADLLVAVLVMPLGLVNELFGNVNV